MKYKCTKCSWVGTVDEMKADYFTVSDESGDYIEEIWSNWICPTCDTWHQLEDYEWIEE